MSRGKIVLSAPEQRVLEKLGENIRSARLRRRITSVMMAEKASISRPTLIAMEAGMASVSVGMLVKILCVLGLERDFREVACDDDLKQKLRETGALLMKRVRKKK